VQFDTLKPTLNAPGTHRLKLEFDGLVSNFAFNFNLRHYSWDAMVVCTQLGYPTAYVYAVSSAYFGQGSAVQVDPIKPMLKAPGTKRLKLRYDVPLSNFAFNFNLRRYTKAPARF